MDADAVSRQLLYSFATENTTSERAIVVSKPQYDLISKRVSNDDK
jgi:hypothetical protein